MDRQTTPKETTMTARCTPDKALTFALTTDYGRRYGVRDYLARCLSPPAPSAA